MLRKALAAPFTVLLALLLTGLALAAAAPSADARPDVRIPRTYDAAVHHIAHATTVRSLPRFVSPTGNLYCALSVPGLPPACELGSGAIKDTSVCTVPQISSYVGRIEFRRGRAVPICNTDTIRTPGAKVLGYGQADHVPGSRIECVMETIGVTCINLNKTEGFFLHRGEYDIFNAG